MKIETVRHKILVVDDTPVNIRILMETLRDDYQIMAAKSGPKALEMALQHLPDLILLDIMMPDMDGFEVIRRLKDSPHTNTIPVIFVTALSEAVDEARGLSLGAIDYISKPFHLPIVKARVKNHILLKRRTDLLEKLTAFDGLTEIPNRRRLDDVLAAEWQRARRNRTPLTLVMMDVDYFKPYNDHYGHTMGDDCLRQVARAISDTLKRPADLPARYGGEEFTALLPETGLAAGVEIAEKIRKAIFDLHIPHAHSEAAPHITISAGIATIVPDDNDDTNALFIAADRKLYEAKTNGRNRVCA